MSHIQMQSPREAFMLSTELDHMFTDSISSSAFICRVNGDGMEGAGIYDKDWLIFDPDIEAENGDIVMMEVYGQWICRRVFFIRESSGKVSRICVRREDTLTPDMTVDAEDVLIKGVFSGLVRNTRKSRSPHYKYLSPDETEAGKKPKDDAGHKKQELSKTALSGGSGVIDSSASIMELGLPSRIMNCFINIGMHTINDLLDVPDKESLLAIPGIGKAGYGKVLDNLEAHGFNTIHLRW